MTARETIERMARALCDADNGFPDDPSWPGTFPTFRGERITSLQTMLNEWSGPIYPMWARYVDDARRAAVAAGIITRDEPIDFSDIPQWELVKKEAKD